MSKALKINALPDKETIDFARTLCEWQKKHGRHDLPWQQDLSPYPVWLSEIMLQQTQVKTVIEYYLRFMERFPSVQALAQASEDEVLSLWSGLGYYSRARNLHLCAKEVVSRHGGNFPQSIDALMSLPGIGPSSAAAIASICFSCKVAIFDGNVKRVLSRFLGFQEDLSVSVHSKTLALMAQDLLPKKKSLMPTYTQAIMDLGATVCKPRHPSCGSCPLSVACKGLQSGEPSRLPLKTQKIKRTQRHLYWLIIQDGKGRVLGVKRQTGSPSGIWRGLYAFPEFESLRALRQCLPPQCKLLALEPMRHELTHQSLIIQAFLWIANESLELNTKLELKELKLGQWMDARDWSAVGVPKPVEDCLKALL